MKIMTRVAVSTIVSVCFAALTGCGSSSPSGGGPTTTSYVGTVAGGASESGVITVTVNAAVAVTTKALRSSTTVSGTLTLHGTSAVTLSGTYDSSSGALSLSGSGYTFTGTVTTGASGGMSGTYTSPTAGGGGGFALTVSTAANVVTTYCGVFAGSATGTWNIQANATSGSGSWYATTVHSNITCTRSSNTLTCNGTASDGSANSSTATISGGSISGTWSGGGGTSGTFTGGACS